MGYMILALAAKSEEVTPRQVKTLGHIETPFFILCSISLIDDQLWDSWKIGQGPYTTCPSVPKIRSKIQSLWPTEEIFNGNLAHLLSFAVPGIWSRECPLIRVPSGEEGGVVWEVTGGNLGR